MMDFDKAADMSGARFVILKDKLALLERALSFFMLDIHTQQHHYTEISPPSLVRDKALFGTGQLPKFSQDLFKTNCNDLQILRGSLLVIFLSGCFLFQIFFLNIQHQNLSL